MSQRFYTFMVPAGASVLTIDCAAEKPLQKLHNSTQIFEYICISSIIKSKDIQALFEQIKPLCNAQTRIIIDWQTQWWHMGISSHDIRHFLYLAEFDVISTGSRLISPLRIKKWVVARVAPQITNINPTVSVIIPCRNERGNIEAAIKRCPDMGAHTEIIFVDGHSKDNTVAEMERVKALYPHKDIKILLQTGAGKADAVRLGFATATGDVLMILDGDLTVIPEDLPKFYEALVQGKGDLINGSRLVYGMESGAMQFCNWIANHGFSFIFSWLLGQRMKDTLCGTKVLYATNYQKIADNRAFFGDFDPFGDFDLLFGAAKQHFKIIDVPIHYKNRTYGSTQIHRWSHGLLLIKMCFFAFKKFKLW